MKKTGKDDFPPESMTKQKEKVISKKSKSKAKPNKSTFPSVALNHTQASRRRISDVSFSIKSAASLTRRPTVRKDMDPLNFKDSNDTRSNKKTTNSINQKENKDSSGKETQRKHSVQHLKNSSIHKTVSEHIQTGRSTKCNRNKENSKEAKASTQEIPQTLTTNYNKEFDSSDIKEKDIVNNLDDMCRWESTMGPTPYNSPVILYDNSDDELSSQASHKTLGEESVSGQSIQSSNSKVSLSQHKEFLKTIRDETQVLEAKHRLKINDEAVVEDKEKSEMTESLNISSVQSSPLNKPGGKNSDVPPADELFGNQKGVLHDKKKNVDTQNNQESDISINRLSKKAMTRTSRRKPKSATTNKNLDEKSEKKDIIKELKGSTKLIKYPNNGKPRWLQLHEEANRRSEIRMASTIEKLSKRGLISVDIGQEVKLETERIDTENY